ncbi:hypothetical protein H2248_009578 [Termitomyces sp. 'cryptogamus']|nr:hypothetical protein H2248_009578 [Termitomyces sp. 'cryptogamus']
MRLYTDSCLLRSLADLGPSTALESIARLDSIIITCGIASGRLDSILSIIKCIQRSYLSINSFCAYAIASRSTLANNDELRGNLYASSSDVLLLLDAPSLLSFKTNYSKSPFAISGFACDWPALVEHPWCSTAYLHSISGPGRVIPVEIGVDYRAQGWTQELMKWDDFLAYLDLDDKPLLTNTTRDHIIYLAQHNLSLQFPELLKDIIVPDYVYVSLDPPEFCHYRPPGNDEQLVINMWLGPKGTISPAHTDPYHNLFVQVVGRKMVWLAPPNMTASMYPFSSSEDAQNPDVSSSGINNTSCVDVFNSAGEEFPDFWENVVPKAMSIILKPGDLLYIPPGWWHAMRSEETSFSVSMWF